MTRSHSLIAGEFTVDEFQALPQHEEDVVVEQQQQQQQQNNNRRTRFHDVEALSDDSLQEFVVTAVNNTEESNTFTSCIPSNANGSNNDFHEQITALYEEIQMLKTNVHDLTSRMNDIEEKNTNRNSFLSSIRRSYQQKKTLTRKVKENSINYDKRGGTGLVRGMHSFLTNQIDQRLSLHSHHTNSNSTHHDEFEILEDGVHWANLSEEIFSLMKIKPLYSWSWLFSLVVYFIQLCLLIMIFIEQSNSSTNSSAFNVPFQVEVFTRLGQCIAIIIAISVSKDLFIPIKELSNLHYRNSSQWSRVIGVQEDKTTLSQWMYRILVPNVFQFLMGSLNLLVSFIIIIQSDDVIQLFADFAAMGIIAEIDDIAFWFAESGYVGEKIRQDTKAVRSIRIKDKTRRRRTVLFFMLLAIMVTSFLFVVQRQINGHYFKQVYPACKIPIEDIRKLGNNVCNGGFVNSFQCGFDDGDCIDFNIAYPNCNAASPEEVGDGTCQRENDNENCGFDGGDCCAKNGSPLLGDGSCHAGLFQSKRCLYDNGDCDDLRMEYPLCPDYDGEDIKDALGEAIVVGNGICDQGKEYMEHYMTEECGWVFGDCMELRKKDLSMREKYPLCKVEKDFFKIGNGICDGGEFVTEECGWEEYDCCDKVDHSKIGDGICDREMLGTSYLRRECGYEEYDCCTVKNLVNDGICGIPEKYIEIESFELSAYTLECGWDGNDCTVDEYPNCQVRDANLLGDGLCNGGSYNTEECGWDGGDCIQWNEKFPNCNLTDFSGLGDGLCHKLAVNPSYLGFYAEISNSEDCGWDGGDCLAFNAQFPDCDFFGNFEPFRIGDGYCNIEFNTTQCGWDGGDCIDGISVSPHWLTAQYPHCVVENPSLIGDGVCHGFDGPNYYNSRECGFDGGDCIVFNAEFKDCNVSNPTFINNGKCDGGDYNSEQCQWDGGDCKDYNTLYPECDVEYPFQIGDRKCDFRKYNTIECGWDGGDCELYKDCNVYGAKSFISNGWCDGGSYNTAECQWDGGDCLEFMETYPDCKVYRPGRIGDGSCDEAPYNTLECGWDGGDCTEFNELYKNCTVLELGYIGDGWCDLDYNTVECNYDGGDCIEFNNLYAGCKVDDPLTLGNLKCSIEQNNAECGWDGGDCVEFNSLYPNCTVPLPEKIGNLECNGGIYNTEECGWDGEDCIRFNEKFPNCTVELVEYIGDNSCDGGLYNTAECLWDGGDCKDFNEMYPNCTAPYPSLVGTGWCDNWHPLYNTSECGYDGGDCL